MIFGIPYGIDLVDQEHQIEIGIFPIWILSSPFRISNAENSMICF